MRRRPDLRRKKMVSAQARRGQVVYAQRRGVSVRKACALLSVARSTLGYESRLAKRDEPVVAVMRELAAQYPRYGYRRIQVFLARRGHVMSADRTHRLWRLHGLQVPRKRPRRRVASPSCAAHVGDRLPSRRRCSISGKSGAVLAGAPCFERHRGIDNSRGKYRNHQASP